MHSKILLLISFLFICVFSQERVIPQDSAKTNMQAKIDSIKNVCQNRYPFNPLACNSCIKNMGQVEAKENEPPLTMLSLGGRQIKSGAKIMLVAMAVSTVGTFFYSSSPGTAIGLSVGGFIMSIVGWTKISSGGGTIEQAGKKQ